MSPRELAGGGGPGAAGPGPPRTQSTPQCKGPSRLPEHPHDSPRAQRRRRRTAAGLDAQTLFVQNINYSHLQGVDYTRTGAELTQTQTRLHAEHSSPRTTVTVPISRCGCKAKADSTPGRRPEGCTPGTGGPQPSWCPCPGSFGTSLAGIGLGGAVSQVEASVRARLPPRVKAWQSQCQGRGTEQSEEGPPDPPSQPRGPQAAGPGSSRAETGLGAAELWGSE